MHTLYEGAALAVIVVFLFLRDLRATVIAAITLPLSILPAFWAMDVLGFSLNMVSLLAITLSTGILVDDAIVEIENIVRHIRMGKSPYQAALEAADEIGLAVIAISLTIVAVFVPASFMESVPGQFFKQFGITVSVQVLFSLLCARLITPMLAAYFLQAASARGEGPTAPCMRLYTRLVTWSVRHRFITVAIGLVLFVASIWSTGLLPSGFLPDRTRRARSWRSSCRPARSSRDTRPSPRASSGDPRRRPEVTSVFVDGGRIPPRHRGPQGHADHQLRAEVEPHALAAPARAGDQPRPPRHPGHPLLVPRRERQAQRHADRHRPGQRHGGERGDRARRADAAASSSHQRGFDLELNRPELRIYPRRDLAVRLGVSTESLSETIRVATIGDVGPALAKFDAGDRDRADPGAARGKRPRRPAGARAVAGAVAARRRRAALAHSRTSSSAQGPISINRYDRERQATVEADLVGSAALSDAMAAIKALPVMKSLPPGISVTEAGDAELQAELFEGFGSAMRNGLMMVYVVLAILFGSLLQPLTILFSLPLVDRRRHRRRSLPPTSRSARRW